MDYLYENLGHERFQEFCHCLINSEFENTQAFPVGQPDGGRDSVSYYMDSKKKEFIVFQVKYVKNPLQVKDIHKWLVEIIDGEKKKIEKLIPKGAKSYYLITNVKGTAHLDNGSIDKLKKILEENISIPSLCWWRDDLSRKLESDSQLKWSFPELLNGQDILNNIIFQNLNENKERRESVIKAYLIDQYEIDNEVKFKQIELQNKLFDLFVDVPVEAKIIYETDKKTKRTLNYLRHHYPSHNKDIDFYGYEDTPNIGAASFILNQHVQQNIERILLEGGPGQGKSTISQFVCQVHRVRLLQKQSEIDTIPKALINTPIRIPLKIDLRDIGSWVEKSNPYAGILGEDYFNKNWHKSLEAFLIAHICYHSKLEDFTTIDFISISKLSSILLVFDGFDEIANISLREEIIEFINRGINRLKENTNSIQVVITSRPAAFSSSIGFSPVLYPHFELGNITQSTTKEYVEKWIKSRKLRKREATAIRKLVDQKLEMPHLKDLTKSPMQLAILISLLNTRGESLPNKRTSLYDSYIELFFNREAEKNTIIRDKRDLIIDIHQYLAWVLHSETEQYKNSGRIEIDKLNAKVKEYLVQEGHDIDIADKLFTVMKERVCALVSRVQGTFEFEVQPLREYFCAKYLYNTSPYAPAGSERTGTKPERFEALARNLYWHNVVRFFAGCFDRGELPMLIQKMNELQEDEILKFTNYPRVLTAQLLSDWVFTQYPKLLKDVVKIITDGLNIRNILNQERHINSSDTISIPYECGRIEIVDECFAQLIKLPSYDYALELINILLNNPINTAERWIEYCSNFKNNDLTTWLEYGYHLQVLHKIKPDYLNKLLDRKSPDFNKRIQLLIRANRIDIINENLDVKDAICDGILDGELFFFTRQNRNHIFSTLSFLHHSFSLINIVSGEKSAITFKRYISGHYNYFPPNEFDELPFTINEAKSDNDKKIQFFFKTIEKTLDIDIVSWSNSIVPWDKLIESSRKAFGDKWSQKIVAVIAAGIKSQREKYNEYDVLHDTSKSLCKRVRNARLKSGNTKWWKQQIEESDDIEFTFLVLFTWGTFKTINSITSIFIDRLEQLEQEKLEKLIDSLTMVSRINHFDLINQKRIETFVKKQTISPFLKYILSLRFPELKKQKFIYKNISDFPYEIKDIVDLKLEYLIEKYLTNPNDLTILSEIKKFYKIQPTFIKRHYQYEREYNEKIIPYERAIEIMKECKDYPRVLSSQAEKACRINASKTTVPIGEISEKNRWFKEN